MVASVANINIFSILEKYKNFSLKGVGGKNLSFLNEKQGIHNKNSNKEMQVCWCKICEQLNILVPSTKNCLICQRTETQLQVFSQLLPQKHIREIKTEGGQVGIIVEWEIRMDRILSILIMKKVECSKINDRFTRMKKQLNDYMKDFNHAKVCSYKKGKIGEQCSICLNGEKKELVQLLCNHTFHFDCLLKWTSLSSSCPLCRMIF